MLVRKRQCYWHNDPRNDLIAAVAVAFRTKDTEQLWHHGLFLAEEDDVLQAAGPTTVTILAESVEHARELHRRLDGWKLWNAVPRASKRESRSLDIVEPWDSCTLDRVILTLTRASQLSEVYTDVLIVASGQGWPDVLPGFPPRLPHQVHQVALVDLADDGDTDTRQATLSRQRAYADCGWKVVRTPAWMGQSDE